MIPKASPIIQMRILNYRKYPELVNNTVTIQTQPVWNQGLNPAFFANSMTSKYMKHPFTELQRKLANPQS